MLVKVREPHFRPHQISAHFYHGKDDWPTDRVFLLTLSSMENQNISNVFGFVTSSTSDKFDTVTEFGLTDNE